MIEQWAMVEGFLLPILISIVLRERWGDTAKAVGTFVICVVFAVGSTYMSGKLDLSQPDFLLILNNILTVFVVAIASFKGFYNKTGLTDLISKATG